MVINSKTCSPVEIPTEYIEAFRKKALDLHNKYRAYHGVSPLISDSLYTRQVAENYAKKLASGFNIEHNPELQKFNLGENLSLFMSPFLHNLKQSDFENYAVRSVNAWYREILLYDFEKPEFSPEVGHFTQLVWKDTRMVEFAISLTDTPDEKGRYYLYIVANYWRPGNFKSKLKSQVLPPLNEINNENIDKLIDNNYYKINKYGFRFNNNVSNFLNDNQIKKSKSKVEFQLNKNAIVLNYKNKNDVDTKKTLIKSKSDAILTLPNKTQYFKSFSAKYLNQIKSISSIHSNGLEVCKLEEKKKSFELLNERITNAIKSFMNKKKVEKITCHKKQNALNKLSNAIVELNRKDNEKENCKNSKKCNKLFKRKFDELNKKYLKQKNHAKRQKYN